MRDGSQFKNMMRILPLILLILLLLSGCKTIRETQTEYVYVNNNDSLTHTKFQRDSIFIHDFIERWRDGDTVYIREHHIEYRGKTSSDTVHWVKTVTITNKLYYTKEKEVNRLYWWQTALMWTGVIAILTIMLMIIWKSARHKR